MHANVRARIEAATLLKKQQDSVERNPEQLSAGLYSNARMQFKRTMLEQFDTELSDDSLLLEDKGKIAMLRARIEIEL